MKLNPFTIMAEQFDGTGLIFSPETNTSSAINKTGVYLWRRLEAGAGEEELIRGLLEKYDGLSEAQASADVKTFLQGLRERSYLSEE